jgi:hypothetical protein
LKYTGAGLAAVGVGVAGYFYVPSLYENYRVTKPALTTTTQALTTTLLPTSTTATVSKRGWWKNAKVATASLDYWAREGKLYAYDLETRRQRNCGRCSFSRIDDKG